MVREISLTHGKVALVDDEDFERLNAHRWHLRGCRGIWYACRDVDKKHHMMHREIMNTPENMVTDHINHDGLDNRKENLRVCTQSQNLQNQQCSRGGGSRFKGVSFIASSGKWRARVMVNGKYLSIGCFDTEEDAARAYDRVAREFFESFACLNFPKVN